MYMYMYIIVITIQRTCTCIHTPNYVFEVLPFFPYKIRPKYYKQYSYHVICIGTWYDH